MLQEFLLRKVILTLTGRKLLISFGSGNAKSLGGLSPHIIKLGT
jgi:hypothetical protein